VSLARGAMDDDYDHNDRIYVVSQCNVMYVLSLLSQAQKNKIGELLLA